MTGPKVAQRIPVVSILLHEAKPVLELVCLRLVEVVTCKSVVLKEEVWENEEEGYTKQFE